MNSLFCTHALCRDGMARILRQFGKALKREDLFIVARESRNAVVRCNLPERKGPIKARRK